MHKHFFTPGPSGLYYTVEQHLKQALKTGIGSISHRSQQFRNIYKEAEEELKEEIEEGEGEGELGSRRGESALEPAGLVRPQEGEDQIQPRDWTQAALYH